VREGAVKGFPLNTVERGDRVAVICESESLTFAELDERASRLAHVLLAAGVEPGDRVGIMLPNSIEYVECVAATAKVACASLTINWHLKTDELSWILEDSAVKALVTHRDLADVVERAVASHPCTVVWIGDDYEQRLAAASPTPVEYRWPTSWAVIYTSGTTGRPKGVVHGAAAAPDVMEATQDALAAMWGYRPSDIHLVAGPLYHSGPAGYCNNTLYLGGTVVIMESWDPREFLRLVDSHRVTTTFLTPAHFIRLLEVPPEERARYDTSSLRHVIHAGAPCPRIVKEQMITAFPSTEIWELYGASEGGATRVSPAEWSTHPGTVGQPWPGVVITIRDPETLVELPTGEDGLVFVRPARGRFHYHNDHEKTSSAWHDDGFTVGDVGHVDGDGYLYLTDRRSDMVIRAGVNVYPREIEEVLYAHPDVVDCAVFGIPDDRDGEHLKAMVEARADIGEDELHEFCSARLDPYKVPSVIEFCDTLPRDANGKVLKRRLRDEHWAAMGRAI
jgi:long-chain acyl-CoA synthetase